ncbi:MAG: uroporphyrinogen decarboxylase [Planctomycetota bacterium]|nr:MAG: uroporphyrinogen decarboxylase [Planctomycetota bacterium]
MPETLFLRALAGERTPRPPFWFMRQAGRCLPEYRRLRQEHSFEELLKDAQLGAEVTMMPIERFGMDAAILFTDLLVTLEAMGPELSYTPGPQLSWTVDRPDDLERLADVDCETHESCRVPLECARETRRLLSPDRTLIGFVGAPFTLACYLSEGKGSKNWAKLRRIQYADPEFFERLLDRLAQVSLDFALAQVGAGCDAIQVFDSWAGVAEAGSFRRQVLPSLQKLIGGLRAENVPVIYFVNGAQPHLETMVATGASCLGIDWRMDIADAHAALPAGMPIQGNLDPLILHADPATIRRETLRIVEAVGSRPHIFNLGHGLEPSTPLTGLETLVDTLFSLEQSCA